MVFFLQQRHPMINFPLYIKITGSLQQTVKKRLIEKKIDKTETKYYIFKRYETYSSLPTFTGHKVTRCPF
jgi:hypothetical protein